MNRISTLACLAATAFLGQPSHAQTTQHGASTRVGNATFHHRSDGTSGTSIAIGGSTFHRFSDGTSGSTLRIGNSDFHSFSTGLRGSTQRIGSSSYTGLGGYGTMASTSIGGTTFHTSSNGLGVTTRIGSSAFTTLRYQPSCADLYAPRPYGAR